MITNNPKRGCGTLKKGGYYAQGQPRESGTLASWSWLLSEGSYHHAIYADSVPRRKPSLLLFHNTLEDRQIVMDGKVFISPHLALPSYALIDWVGKGNYSPWDFAQETATHGASRRIDSATALTLASVINKAGAIPIVFAHPHIPVFEGSNIKNFIEHTKSFAELFADNGELYTSDTWNHPDFGMNAGNWHGDNHWIVPVLRQLHLENNNKSSVFSPNLASEMMIVPQIFGASWINKVIYVKHPHETKETLSPIVSHGIVPVDIDK
jgi:hypothetical protein